MDPATFFTELKRRHSRHQREIATSGSDDYEIHYDKHGVVAPSVCSWITPEACAPDKNLLLNRAEHYQYQTGGSELRENAKNYPDTSADFGRAQKNSEAFAHSDVLASRLRFLECFQPLAINTIPTITRKRRSATSVNWANRGNITQ